MALKHDNEHDDLWEVLGHAPKVEPGPFFTQHVLRKVRKGGTERSPVWTWLPATGSGRLAAVLALALAAAAAYTLTRPEPPAVATVAAAGAASVGFPSNEEAAIDYLLIANLDEIIASEENTLWADYSVN